MPDLNDLARLAARESGLCVVSTRRPNGTIQSSVVNVGVLDHPQDGRPVVGFVARGDSRKLIHVRAAPQTSVVARSGWEWVTCEGTAEIIGPDDPSPLTEDVELAELLRQVFRSAGGTHDDWATYDRVMAEERRAAVLVTPTRVYSNG